MRPFPRGSPFASSTKGAHSTRGSLSRPTSIGLCPRGKNDVAAAAAVASLEMKKQLLIIDDDPGVRDSLSCAFEPCGRVWAVPTIAQGLEILRQDRIDLVVLDYCLPDRPGDQALRMIKRSWPSLPVIVITGYGSESVCAHLFRLGARDYFSKPYDLNALARTVQELLACPKKRLRRNVLASLPSARRREEVPRAHPGIQRALSWIHAHYTEPISMGNAAKEAALSRCHFCRLFKVAVGIGYRAYLTRYRVEKAKELLQGHQWSATEVAYAAGFADYSSFYEAFRRMTGQGPRTWRRALVVNSSPATSPI